MNMDHFLLLPNSQAEPVQLAYTDVQQVGTGGLTTGTQLAIVGGALLGAVLALALCISQTSG